MEHSNSRTFQGLLKDPTNPVYFWSNHKLTQSTEMFGLMMAAITKFNGSNVRKCML